MLAIQRSARYISCLLVIAMAMLSLPHRHAWAAMAGTESVITSAPSAKVGDANAQHLRIKAFLERQDVRAQLQSHGISAREAQARIDSLTDEEVALVARQLERLPLGAGKSQCAFFCPKDSVVLIAIAIFVAFLVLMIWDITRDR